MGRRCIGSVSKRMQGEEMTIDVYRIIKYLWLLCAVIVLLVVLYNYDGAPNSDVDVFLAYGMLAISFPVGLLITVLASGMGYLAYVRYGYVIPVSYWSISITWFCFVSAGYWQWFVLVPGLWRRWKARRGSAISG